MSQENKIKFIIFGILILLCFIITSAFLILLKDDKTPKNPPEQKIPFDMQPVSEYSYFFSQVNNINKYLNYNKNKNNIALYNTLAKEFIDTNQITIDNILTKIELYNESPTFKAKEMYYKEQDNKFIYYLIGDITTATFEEIITLKENVKYFLLVDYNRLSMAIYPVYNDIETIPINMDNLPLNSFNEIEASNIVTNDYICNLYYSSYIDKLVNNIDESYELLEDDFKNKNFANKEKYIEFMNNKLKSISLDIKNCTKTTRNDKRIYTIFDGNNTFNFIEESIMNYRVSFN